jgi:hypothetical protein
MRLPLTDTIQTEPMSQSRVAQTARMIFGAASSSDADPAIVRVSASSAFLDAQRAGALRDPRAEEEARQDKDAQEELERQQAIVDREQREGTEIVHRAPVRERDDDDPEHARQRLTEAHRGPDHQRKRRVRGQEPVTDHEDAAEHEETHGGRRREQRRGLGEGQRARPPSPPRGGGQEDRRHHQDADRIADPPGHPEGRGLRPGMQAAGAEAHDAHRRRDQRRRRGAEDHESRHVPHAGQAPVEPRGASQQPERRESLEGVACGDRERGEGRLARHRVRQEGAQPYPGSDAESRRGESRRGRCRWPATRGSPDGPRRRASVPLGPPAGRVPPSPG